MRLWRSLWIVCGMISAPWVLFGDFNNIVNAEEKKGGVPHTLSMTLDFISSMYDSALMDLVKWLKFL